VIEDFGIGDVLVVQVPEELHSNSNLIYRLNHLTLSLGITPLLSNATGNP
jgi:hypothetical protein